MQADGAVDLTRHSLSLKKLEKSANVVPNSGSLHRAIHYFENSAANVSVSKDRQSAALLVGDQLGPAKEPKVNGVGKYDRLSAEETEVVVERGLLLPRASDQV